MREALSRNRQQHVVFENQLEDIKKALGDLRGLFIEKMDRFESILLHSDANVAYELYKNLEERIDKLEKRV